VVDHAALAHDAVVDCLEAVPVGIEEERAVVVLPVLRSRPGRAVVSKAGFGSHSPELVDVRA
jgi:hypothetical protein